MPIRGKVRCRRKSRTPVGLVCLTDIDVYATSRTDKDEWERGLVYAEAQILAREVFIFPSSKSLADAYLQLMELPANMLTPSVRSFLLLIYRS